MVDRISELEEKTVSLEKRNARLEEELASLKKTGRKEGLVECHVNERYQDRVDICRDPTGGGHRNSHKRRSIGPPRCDPVASGNAYAQ